MTDSQFFQYQITIELFELKQMMTFEEYRYWIMGIKLWQLTGQKLQ